VSCRVCLQIVLAKMENPDIKDIIIQIEEICSFDQITSLIFFPFQSCFIYHVLLFVDDVVTSWPQTKISDWSEIKCIVILAVQNRTCSIPKCVSCNYHATSVYTVFFCLWYKFHDTCFTRGLREICYDLKLSFHNYMYIIQNINFVKCQWRHFRQNEYL
jgi:hypothetical protein